MKTLFLALAAAIATGRTRGMIRRLSLSRSQDEPYLADWWIQEIHVARVSRLRDQIGRAIAIRLA